MVANFYLFYLFLSVLYLNDSITASSQPNITYRLPNSVYPTSYVLKFKFDLDTASFSGDARIFVQVKDPIDAITLHSKELDIKQVSLDYVEDIEWSFHPDYDLVELGYTDGRRIDFGEHILGFKFDGKLTSPVNSSSDGVKLIKYTNGDKEGYIVATDFEPFYARTFFPCFDEPHFKSKFSVRVVSPNESYTALSNMKNIAKFPSPEGVVYDFKESVPMSSYLLTVILTDYPYRELIWKNGGIETPLRIYSPDAEEPDNDFALKEAAKVLDYYTEYTGIRYPLEKIDFIEYPRDSAATENWGLITIASGYLCPYQNGTKVDGSAITEVIYHELSHFWFGNLVTNFFWGDLWLQEGFADFFTMMARVDLKPSSINYISHFFEESQAFNTDLGADSVPLSSPVETYGEILKNKFNSVTYKKGSAFLKMTLDTFGAAIFKSAIRKYLEDNAFGSATPNELINAFESQVKNFHVREFMMDWIYQRGFPLVSVEEDEEFWRIAQKPFPAKNRTEKELRQKWTIPIFYYTDKNSTAQQIWFDKDLDELLIPKKNSTWIKLNNYHHSIYKVSYSFELLKKLSNNTQKFKDDDRKYFYQEMLYLLSHRIIDCSSALELIKNSQGNFDDLKWLAKFLSEKLRNNRSQTPFMDFLANKYQDNPGMATHAENVLSQPYKIFGYVETDSAEWRVCAEWLEQNSPMNQNEVEPAVLQVRSVNSSNLK